MNNDYNNIKYTRAKQEEGKDTYEGMRRSQRFWPLRILWGIVIICILSCFALLVQGNFEHHSFVGQYHRDYSALVGGKMGKFSTCDLDHTCKHENKTEKKAQNVKKDVKNKTVNHK